MALLLLIGSATALYFGTARWPDTPDGLIHLQRVRALSEALSAGVLHPRWFPDFSFAYGHPILNYYSPAFYYPPALLNLAGVGVITATRIALALFFGLSGVALYGLLRLWVSRPAALAGAVIYLLFPYHLYDLYIRGALPEFTAFLWSPLLILAAILVARTLNERTGKDASHRSQIAIAVLASLLWAGLILTHNLTALMTTLTMGVILFLIAIGFIVGHGRVQTEAGSRPGMAARVLAWGMISIILGAMLAAWYVVPALWELSWVGIGVAPPLTGYLNHFATWQNLFAWSLIYAYPTAGEPTVPLPGWVLLSVAVGLVALPFVWKKTPASPLIIGLVMTAGALWLTTQSSAALWKLVEPILGKLQFPWRWQSMVAVGVALLIGALIQAASDAIGRRSRQRRVGRPTGNLADAWPGWLLVAAVIGFVAANALLGLDYHEAAYGDSDITRQQMWTFDADHGQIGMTWAGEFLPHWVEEQRWAIGRPPSDGAPTEATFPVTLTVQPRRFGYLDAAYQVNANEPVTLIWHRFYFPAWQVFVDGQPVDSAPFGSLGQLSAVVVGEHLVEVRWMATSAVQLGRGLAWLAWALILGALLAIRVHRRWLAGWVTLGVIALTAMFLPLERQASPMLVGADYGPVRLEAASVSAASPGDAMRVTLNWLVVEPSPPQLTAYVHVVDESGRLVAQHDAPLAGAYTPAERWLPGLLIDRTVEVALPASLPAGVYAVKAGVYEPGKADSPIAPGGQDDSRVDIGTLEVPK